MRTLLIGPDGQIGAALAQALPAPPRITRVPRAALDLARPETIGPVVQTVRPELIINAAGYTAVDEAETQSELAHLINGEAPGVLAREAARIGAALIHYSSDYVFDGTARRPYRPGDTPAPLNAYGRSKLAGEQAVAASAADALVLRTCWVYSARRSNFLLSILRQAASKPELRVVEDQIGCPTPARVIAEATAHIVSLLIKDRRILSGFEIAHVCCRGQTSWFGFARAILDLAAPRPCPRLLPIASSEYPSRAARPAFSALNCAGLEERFAVALPEWRDALGRMLAEERPESCPSGAFWEDAA